MNDVVFPKDERWELRSPTVMPNAASFLWNRKMMMHVNCGGYIVSQYMNPEPEKYSHAPNMEAKTFIQPEQPFYQHHPGRFFYVRDDETGEIFSSPFKPCAVETEEFCFSAGRSDISWIVRHNGIELVTSLSLTADDVVELWSFKVKNLGTSKRSISVYPYFTVGYMSWMNQSASYSEEQGAIVCKSVTPYQKLESYFENQDLKDLTFLASDRKVTSFETRREVFEGQIGLHNPKGLQLPRLEDSEAHYETPVCAMQFSYELESDSEERVNLLFGPAKTTDEIGRLRERYLVEDGLDKAKKNYREYVSKAFGNLSIETPDKSFDDFVNNWLPKQVYYHGDINRLTTDPQTRNYLQDAMGMAYIDPTRTRSAFVRALSQQNEDGSMPDGILLDEAKELKYINQVPHTDHCAWIPICLRTYIDETADESLLHEEISFADSVGKSPAHEHVTRAMNWLLSMRDERGLIYIAQGDWCDPMNMVGYKGRGVSGWLTLATAFAINEWLSILDEFGIECEKEALRRGAAELNESAREHLWRGNWFARGITDDGRVFGIEEDVEGKIFLNPQTWSLLSGAAEGTLSKKVIDAVKDRLETPFGVELLSPAFTGMVEDIGRVTQKFPGSAENGSIYNHAAAFWAYALFNVGAKDDAFRVLRKMLPDADDFQQRGQLPVFIPNYYRGAYKQYPRTAGRSSQMFNTGTVHWFYRSLIDGLLGLRGCRDGLSIEPKLPSTWDRVSVERRFRGAQFKVVIERGETAVIKVDGVEQQSKVLSDIEEGKVYNVEVSVCD